MKNSASGSHLNNYLHKQVSIFALWNFSDNISLNGATKRQLKVYSKIFLDNFDEKYLFFLSENCRYEFEIFV